MQRRNLKGENHSFRESTGYPLLLLLYPYGRTHLLLGARHEDGSGGLVTHLFRKKANPYSWIPGLAHRPNRTGTSPAGQLSELRG